MTTKPRRLLGLSGKMPGKSKTTRVTRGTCSYRAHHSWHHNRVFRGPDGMSLLLDFGFQLFATPQVRQSPHPSLFASAPNGAI